MVHCDVIRSKRGRMLPKQGLDMRLPLQNLKKFLIVKIIAPLSMARGKRTLSSAVDVNAAKRKSTMDREEVLWCEVSSQGFLVVNLYWTSDRPQTLENTLWSQLQDRIQSLTRFYKVPHDRPAPERELQRLRWVDDFCHSVCAQ
jgi:hypothetical protein